jgi:hypothetical protein
MGFIDIVFLQDSEATVVLDLLDSDGEQAAMDYLKQFDMGEYDGDELDKPSHGRADHVYRDGRYIMSYNTSLGYIGLCIEIANEGATYAV